VLTLPLTLASQPISFFHLTASDGLSDNYIRSLVIDKNGFLWVGTDEALNVFNGYSVTSYSKENYTQMPSSNAVQLQCDKDNNIWMATSEGIIKVTNSREIQRIILKDTVKRFHCKNIIELKSFGPVLFTNLGQFFQDKSSGKWNEIEQLPSILKFSNLWSIERFAEDRIIFTVDSFVVIWDYKQRRIVYKHLAPGAINTCNISPTKIAIGFVTGLVTIINIETGKEEDRYQLTEKVNGKNINIRINEIDRAADGSLVISCGFKGFVVIDTLKKIHQYKHDPINPRSIISSNIYRVFAGSTGEVIVGTTTSGISMYNVFNSQTGFTGHFIDTKGDYIDNFIVNKIAEDKKGVLWLSTQDRLIRWDKKNNVTGFYYLYQQVPETGLRSADIRALCFDNKGRLWAGITGEGVTIFEEASGKFKKIAMDTSREKAWSSKFIPCMILASDGNIWACSSRGVFTINPSTLQAKSCEDHPVLKAVYGKRINELWEDKQKRIWMTTNFAGVYCYDPVSNRLINYTSKNGLPSDICYMVRQHINGDYYITTSKGLGVIGRDGTIKSYTKINGLRNERCESLEIDDENRIWISNNNCLIRFEPDKNKMEFFDESAGFLNEGFRVGTCFKTSTGEMLWSGYRGISHFFPHLLKGNTMPLKLVTYEGSFHDTVFHFRSNEAVRLSYPDNSFTFLFSAMQLGFSEKIQYRYLMDGYDKDWQKGGLIPQARYTSLPSGTYIFKVKASRDGINWSSSENEIAVTVVPPLWKRWWFIWICAFLVAGSAYFYSRNRNKKLELQKERLETEQAINYFATSLYTQQSVDSILWDVARNCIGRLHFEDCVIYLMDEERKVLVQKAAHGPKSPKQFEIDQPIEIPLGKGIVGNVALNGKAEIINDTTKDPRYIVDDERRYSEITVPIKSDDKVLGVIDCEHSKKGFFTQKHLSILTTIASLCANKIVRAKAEEEKQMAQATLIATQQKMTEVEMQALRAQMNPHFIFNSLNSINRYIVKSDQATASLYLTRFARLIRLILDNSNSKNVILSHELEALKLYIEMEALRFDKKFEYNIIVDKSVNPDSVELPPLIIQPYVENAIWHGLLHKDTPGCLTITVSMPEENMLQCIIEDNGIGRQKAKELRSKSATTRKSLGLKLTENRLALLNKYAEINASIDIIDLTNGDDGPGGTKVILKIPV
jgi:ligand-binding sensor domain-containing protein/putative methionine-R-sulfoxide reductase with GAF domain